MNELIQKYKDKFKNYWQKLEKKQKILLGSSAVLLFLSLVLVTVLSTSTKYVPTFVDLNDKTANTVVTKLDEMGITYEIGGGGSIISVPEAEADKVKITVAPELESGNFYSKFWESASYGSTDSELAILERDAIEQELRALIVNGIDGIINAEVMITLPEEKVFYSEENEKATASVIINIEPGVNLNSNQIKTVYYLISRSIPNLPIDNITLSNQYGDLLEYSSINPNSAGTSYDEQRRIEVEFQQDVKTDIEKMLKEIYGNNNISVTVIAKMNFDQKRTVENIKEPVVGDQGIVISSEEIQSTTTGGNSAGGVSGTGVNQVPSYQSGTSSDGSSEYSEERINYEVNEITNEIISSPYHLEDLSVSIAVNLDNEDDQTAKVLEDIKNLISPIVSTALSTDDTSNNNVIDINSKIAVIANQFEPQTSYFDGNQNNLNSLLLYGGIGLAVLAVGGVAFALIRRGRNNKTIEDAPPNIKSEDLPQHEFDFTPVLSEEAALQKEIQKISKKKPDEFVKLLRTWLYEE